MILLRELVDKVVKASSSVLVEKEREVTLITLAIIAGGHALIEGVPGIAKTLSVKVVAKALGLTFSRIQMTPDMLPSDIIGTKIIDPRTGEERLLIGPINANIVLADEINRASPRTQSALLEAMQERQVTIEGLTVKLPEPFSVIATMNPLELEGVFPLPEAQLDRFFLKIKDVGLSESGLKVLLKEGLEKIEEKYRKMQSVSNSEEVLQARKDIEKVYVDGVLLSYIARIVRNISSQPSVRAPVSPRAAGMLLTLSKEFAIIDGRDYLIPDDVKKAAIPSLSHRIFLKPEFLAEGLTGEEVVKKALESVEVPRP